MNDELSDYDYVLPESLIAQQPLANRLDARLMIVDRKENTISHATIREFPNFLRKNDCLVLNDTKVVPARLYGYRNKTLGAIEALFIGEHGRDWLLLCKAKGKLHEGEIVSFQSPKNESSIFEMTLRERGEEGIWKAQPFSNGCVYALLEKYGSVPLPPYIRGGKMESHDVDSYQSVYAKSLGAVAAPTAGLHFTPELLEQIRQNGVVICNVTLHVGIGTFRPITAARLSEHKMHSEFAELTEENAKIISQQKEKGGRIVSVGTTSVRVLETAENKPFSGKTNLFIKPPYDFKCVDALLTNFHFPKSTLLILVRTFGGDMLLKKAYEEAVQNEYRFYSYGDAMFIF